MISKLFNQILGGVSKEQVIRLFTICAAIQITTFSGVLTLEGIHHFNRYFSFLAVLALSLAHTAITFYLEWRLRK